MNSRPDTIQTKAGHTCCVISLNGSGYNMSVSFKHTVHLPLSVPSDRLLHMTMKYLNDT